MPSYLITDMSHRGGLFRLDSVTRRRECLLPGRFRGVTLGPDGWAYSVTGSRPHQGEVPTHIHRVCLQTGEGEDLGPLPYQGCHDLRWIDGAFYLVASTANLVVRLDEGLRETGRMQIVEDPADVCHVNCLAARDGRLFATIFTLDPRPRARKRLTRAWSTEGKILDLDFERGAWSVRFEPLAQPHSLTWRGDWLYLMESHVGRLVRVHLERGVLEPVAQLSGFARGVAFAGDELLVGVTQMFRDEREKSAAVPFTVRLRDRWRPFEGLLVLDPDTGRTRRRLPWAGAQVYDLLALTTG